jgi:2-keto-4-pentenoate hydratase/2-oxohepta-3-ene-1,7-dioic acid hydratase in catechol pathway
MKLVTYAHNGAARLGAIATKRGREVVIDLHAADPLLPADMLAFLQGGPSALTLARKAIKSARSGLDLKKVKLLAPIPRPGKIICIGLNYRDHAEETGQAIPTYPVVFSKYANTVIGPDANIVLPKGSSQVDYEAELGFIIGARARNVAEDKALAYVAGYTIINDVSARDYQMKTSQWTMGKTFDTFAPMGPALVTADEIADPHKLDIRLTIGDETLQNSSTKHLIFGIPKLMAALSEVMTLEPGDVVSTGTPPGVGVARKPQRFLKPGDVVSVTIAGLGTLTNPVVAEK